MAGTLVLMADGSRQRTEQIELVDRLRPPTPPRLETGRATWLSEWLSVADVRRVEIEGIWAYTDTRTVHSLTIAAVIKRDVEGNVKY